MLLDVPQPVLGDRTATDPASCDPDFARKAMRQVGVADVVKAAVHALVGDDELAGPAAGPLCLLLGLAHRPGTAPCRNSA